MSIHSIVTVYVGISSFAASRFFCLNDDNIPKAAVVKIRLATKDKAIIAAE